MMPEGGVWTGPEWEGQKQLGRFMGIKRSYCGCSLMSKGAHGKN